MEGRQTVLPDVNANINNKTMKELAVVATDPDKIVTWETVGQQPFVLRDMMTDNSPDRFGLYTRDPRKTGVNAAQQGPALSSKLSIPT